MVDTEEPCPNCGEDAPPISDQASGDLICTNCGAVMQDHNIDDGAEWRIFDDTTEAEKASKNRAGTKVNPYLTNGGIESTRTGDRALDRVCALSNGNDNRVLRTVFDRIKRIQDDLNFSEAALHVSYELAASLEKLKSRALRLRAADHAALVYLACRQEDEGRSFREIAAVVSDATAQDIGKAYLRIEKLLPRAVQRALKTEVLPETFLPRFCNRMGLSMEVEKAARQVCQAPSVVNAGSRQYAAVALAALYLIAWMSNIDLPVGQVASIAKITESSLLDCINHLRPLISEVLPSNFKKLRIIKDLPRALGEQATKKK
eukprot:GEMP01027716.1.p1 GENE.GEMP01027716.1~~GEMP01027716.1.p1  ORF type:complete len:318 (+),score=47.04 GEMP01027716.1:45-998(+)